MILYEIICNTIKNQNSRIFSPHIACIIYGSEGVKNLLAPQVHVPDLLEMFEIQLSFFLSLYTARPSFEYYRQVYYVHSGLQDESLQVTISKLP